MKTIGTYLSVVLFAALFTACKKDDVTLPESNSPVFHLVGNLGTESIDLTAGDDGAFMNTTTQNENGVKVFTGSLGNGATSIELGLYDGNIDQENTTPVTSIKQSLEWASTSGQNLVVLSKQTFPNHLLIDEIEWSLNGSFAGVNDVAISEPGLYEVCATVAFYDGTTQQLCNDIIVGYYRNSNCRIRHYINQSGQLTVWLDKIQGSVEEISWFIDGELAGKNNEFSGLVSTDNHLVTADIKFANGVHRTKSLIIDGTLSGKFIDDFTVFEQNNSNSTHRDYNWRLNISHGGTTYSSMSADNSGATISVTSVDYYGLNANNKNVYKINATVNANVRESGSSSDIPVSFSTVFGLEIPD